jgi:hypothetical protein
VAALRDHQDFGAILGLLERGGWIAQAACRDRRRRIIEPDEGEIVWLNVRDEKDLDF